MLRKTACETRTCRNTQRMKQNRRKVSERPVNHRRAGDQAMWRAERSPVLRVKVAASLFVITFRLPERLRTWRMAYRIERASAKTAQIRGNHGACLRHKKSLPHLSGAITMCAAN